MSVCEQYASPVKIRIWLLCGTIRMSDRTRIMFLGFYLDIRKNVR